MSPEETAHTREEDPEVMSILLNSTLFAEMSATERQELLRYLVTSYFQPRAGENCRAHLKAVRSASAAL